MANERPLTLADCRRLLADFALPDKFDSALNQCIERIYSEGQWPGSKVEVDLTPYVEDYVITLPYEYETLMACNWNRSSVPITDINAEYVPNGAGTQTAGEGMGCVVDLGLVPTADDGDYTVYLHKYKLAFQYTTGQDLTGLVRRRFLYLTDEQDYVYPAHLGALKNGLLAVRYEDEGDLDRATGYWTRCFDFLSNAAAQTKIGSRQPLNGAFNLGGTGGNKGFY
jgi:hypothetical protein